MHGWRKKFKARSILLLPLSTSCLALPALAQAQFTVATNDGAITITGYTGGAEAATIPSLIDSKPVVAIGQDAFEFTDVASVAIPDSVTSIGYEAFGGCTNLSSVTMPNSITNIGQYAFFQCSALANISIPSGVTIMRDEVFGLCSSLATITLSANVTNIQGGAFQNCYSLTAIYFLGNAPSLGMDAFKGDSETTAYYLPGTTGWAANLANLPAVETGALFQISGASIQAGQFQFAISGSSNQVVVIEACFDISAGNWQPIQTNTMVRTTSSFTDSEWENYPSRFYRLRSP